METNHQNPSNSPHTASTLPALISLSLFWSSNSISCSRFLTKLSMDCSLRPTKLPIL